MSANPRILIVTAAFGEGHNSAARNLALALEAKGAITQVSDPCMLTLPRLTAVVNWGYRQVTNRFPRLWEKIYHSTDRCDFNQKPSRVMRMVQDRLADLIEQFRPDAVVSTYPLYPYFLSRIVDRSPKKFPVFISVTDSIEINATWLRARCDHWLVTDSATRDSMVGKGINRSQVIETGFPVHPAFAMLSPLSSADSCETFRVLYFPTASLRFLRRHGRALLDASPSVHLTIVLGRNVRMLYSRARELQLAYPGRVRLIGWTRRVPQLLNSHHLVVGKAGGATVHEAIAARCPMLIHHLVPGQEEGNLQLLEKIGGGRLADASEALGRSVADLLSNQARSWRVMKDSLAQHDRNSGALVSADFILNHLAHSTSPAVQAGGVAG
jgi:processive 1,2-diacylglycerol beta-glucosyltransferase